MPRKAILLLVSLLLVGSGVAATQSSGTPESENSSPNNPTSRLVFRVDALPSPGPPPCLPLEEGSGASEPCARLVYHSNPSAEYVCIKLPNQAECDGPNGRMMVTARTGLFGVHLDYWEWAAVGPDDQTIVLGFQTQEYCWNFDRVEVEERAEAFVITVFTGADPAKVGKKEDGSIAGCPLPGSIPSAIFLTLPSPLGNRQLLDGSGIDPEESRDEDPPAPEDNT